MEEGEYLFRERLRVSWYVSTFLHAIFVIGDFTTLYWHLRFVVWILEEGGLVLFYFQRGMVIPWRGSELMCYGSVDFVEIAFSAFMR